MTAYSANIKRLMDTLGELALWNAVLDQAWSDAFNTLSDPLSKREKQKAIDWFSLENWRFLHVCGCADRNPDIEMDKFKRRIEDEFLI